MATGALVGPITARKINLFHPLSIPGVIPIGIANGEVYAGTIGFIQRGYLVLDIFVFTLYGFPGFLCCDY